MTLPVRLNLDGTFLNPVPSFTLYVFVLYLKPFSQPFVFQSVVFPVDWVLGIRVLWKNGKTTK